MFKVDHKEILKLPYITRIPFDNRKILLKSFYNYRKKEWILFVQNTKNKRFQRLKGGETVVGSYFALHSANKKQDYYWPLGSFISHHASYSDIVSEMQIIEYNLLRMAAIIEKYNLIFQNNKYDNLQKSLLLQSEIENLFVLTRSYYDYLHKLTVRFSNHLMHIDEKRKKIMSSIDKKNSFAGIALKGDEIISYTKMICKWNMPKKIAKFYQSEASWFRDIRNVRDSITHHGKNAPYIFILKEGPAISVNESNWSNYSFCKNKAIIKNNFISVRGLITNIISHNLNIQNQYIKAIASGILFPNSFMLSKAKLFLRSPFTHYFNNLNKIINNPWEN